ncbi:MAG: four helix bundle protein [Ferruginibacter sp.]|nr:four helix bundle protein [Ferruginibacter sp.]
MITQIRRAALSVHLNISEGASRKSETERKRYYEIARGSIIEIDAALDIANDLEYLSNQNLTTIGELTVKCFKMLTGMIQSKT